MSIKVRYSSIDGVSRSRSFPRVEKARAFAVERVGASPEIGRFYAVSSDGVGKIEVEGCSLDELFDVKPAPPPRAPRFMSYEQWQGDHDAYYAPEPDPDAAFLARYRRGGCVCSLHQLSYVGCDCGAEDGAPLPRPDWGYLNRNVVVDDYDVPF